MRIAHVTDCYLPRLGGIERQVHDLAVRQSELGHEVEIITSVARSMADDDAALIVHRPAGSRDREPSPIRYGSSISGRDVVLDGQFDVVHLHASTWSPLTYLTAFSTTRAGIPTTLTVHSIWSYATPLFGMADAAMRWGRWPIAWSAVSSTAARPLQRVVGPASEVAILPNGVDTSKWNAPYSSRVPGRVVVATVGRLAERKRPRQFLRMLREARALVPAAIEIEAVIVGAGPLRSTLQRYLDRHEMNRWVRLTGTADHDEIRRLFHDVDIYVAPATLESFGIAALEARCAGLPVIAFAKSGVADFIRHGTEGLLARSDAQMASMIAELATSPSMRGRLRQHNTTTDPASGWSEVIRRCERLYGHAADLVGGRRLDPRCTIRS
jgi:glycosyltransferase involved in cell wall biosynthesis